MKFDEIVESLLEAKKLKHVISVGDLSQLVYKDKDYEKLAMDVAMNFGALKRDIKDGHDGVQFLWNIENETGSDVTDDINASIDIMNKKLK